MQTAQEVARTIEALAKEQGLSINRILSDCGLASGAFANMKMRGNMPSADRLHRISKRLGVTVDWLLTGEQAAKEPTKEERDMNNNITLSINEIAADFPSNRTYNQFCEGFDLGSDVNSKKQMNLAESLLLATHVFSAAIKKRDTDILINDRVEITPFRCGDAYVEGAYDNIFRGMVRLLSDTMKPTLINTTDHNAYHGGGANPLGAQIIVHFNFTADGIAFFTAMKVVADYYANSEDYISVNMTSKLGIKNVSATALTNIEELLLKDYRVSDERGKEDILDLARRQADRKKTEEIVV